MAESHPSDRLDQLAERVRAVPRPDPADPAAVARFKAELADIAAELQAVRRQVSEGSFSRHG